jgi:hypothetical protein
MVHVVSCIIELHFLVWLNDEEAGTKPNLDGLIRVQPVNNLNYIAMLHARPYPMAFQGQAHIGKGVFAVDDQGRDGPDGRPQEPEL